MKLSNTKLATLFTFCILTIANLCNAQVQKGLDIDGDTSYENSAHSVCMPDINTIAIGAPGYSHVRIYNWNNSSWKQKGKDILGKTTKDESGYSISMPDSNTIAIGSPFNDDGGFNSGSTCIYKWDGTKWSQKGSTIVGEASYDKAGHAVSMPDSNTVAISSKLNNGNGTESGHVRIFKWDGTKWSQKGMDIDGEVAYDESGHSISMSDSNTIAISAKDNDGGGFNAGHVRIFKWDGTKWSQKGVDIDGKARQEFSGHSVDMPDSNTVAIGTLVGKGHVRIYNWNGTSWIQKGTDILGEAFGDQAGYSISMPNNNTIGIGAIQNDDGGTNAGHTRIHQWDGLKWIQVGLDIDGEDSSDISGCSISMPDSNTIAIGAKLNDGNGNNSGHARIYSLCSTTYTDTIVACVKYKWIDGKSYTESNKNAKHILVNSSGCDSVVTLNFSYEPYERTDTIISCTPYTWIDGKTYSAKNDTTTFLVSTSSFGGCDTLVRLNFSYQPSYRIDTIVSCTPYTWIDGITYKSSNITASHLVTTGAMGSCDTLVKLNFTYKPHHKFDTIISCIPYTWIDGKTYTASDSTATYTIDTSAVNGCDSVIHLNLTIKNTPVLGTDRQVVCDSLLWIDGKTYYTNNNTATDTVYKGALNGCDLVTTLDLTIKNAATGIDRRTECDSLVWLDGKTYTTNNNTATHTIPYGAANGCDSIVTLDLTILQSTTGTDKISACHPIQWLDGKTYNRSNSRAKHTITGGASNGCDSIITLNFTYIPTPGTDTQTACDTFKWIDGKTYTSSHGRAQHTLPGIANGGCDSLITLNLTMLKSAKSIDRIFACNSYDWIDGKTYTNSNQQAIHTLTGGAANGCDSIIQLDLTIEQIPTTTTVSGSRIFATHTLAKGYQWLDCNRNYAPISGANATSHQVTKSGKYAVEIAGTHCTDTSDCIAINAVRVSTQTEHPSFHLYPNPTKDKFTIVFKHNQPEVHIEITDIQGKLIQSSNHRNIHQLDLGINQEAGIYLVTIQTSNRTQIVRLVKH